MTERPILFNGEMIRAILDGRKTVTRRPVRCGGALDYFADEEGEVGTSVDGGHSGWGLYVYSTEYPDEGSEFVPSPYGKPGDLLCGRLDVGLCIRCDGRLFAGISEDGSAWEYDRCKKCDASWMHSPPRVPPFGPVPLRVTAVRVDRLQDITPDQREAEGHDKDTVGWDSWDAIYKAKGFGWEANPWVWVTEFERVSHE